MAWLNVVGLFLRAVFGSLLTLDKNRRAMNLEQLKLIVASERARTTKRSALGWAFVSVTVGMLAIDLYVTKGDNLEYMIQLVALALASG